MNEDREIISHIDFLFRNEHGDGSAFLYDEMSDNVFIYGAEHGSLIKYLMGHTQYSEALEEPMRLLWHERQHYIDLNYSTYGAKIISELHEYTRNLEDTLLSGKQPSSELIQKCIHVIAHDIHGRNSKINLHDTEHFPKKIIGLNAKTTIYFLIKDFPQVDKIDISLSNKETGDEVANMTLNDRSIIELSALGAEIIWRNSTSNDSFNAIEEDVFYMIHDFDKPNYIGAFYATHISMQNSSESEVDRNTNFPLSKSLAYGGMIARLAIFLTGTKLAKQLPWHDVFSNIARACNTQSIMPHHRLDCVFFNLVRLSEEIDNRLPAHIWIESLLKRIGIRGGIEEVVFNGMMEISSLADDLPKEAHILKRRLNDKIAEINTNRDKLFDIAHNGLLSFLPGLPIIEWTSYFLHHDETAFLQSTTRNTSEHIRKTLNILTHRALMRSLCKKVWE